MSWHSLGILLLAIFLILYGMFALTNITLVAATIIMGCLAIGSGICLLVGFFRKSK